MAARGMAMRGLNMVDTTANVVDVGGGGGERWMVVVVVGRKGMVTQVTANMTIWVVMFEHHDR